MAGLTPLPPSVLHSSTRLTHAEAHARLSTFLENAENNAAYRPDSTLTQRGPESGNVGSGSELILHHLKRILQGMEGKRIGGGVEEIQSRFFGEGASHGVRVGSRMKRKFDDGKGKEEEKGRGKRREQVGDGNLEDETVGPGVEVEGEQDGWQDKEDYDLAQQDDEVDLMGDKRHPGARLEEPADAEEAEEMAEIEIEDTGRKVGLSEQDARKSTADKEARKKAKKERHRADRRKKEDAKAKAKNKK